MKRLENLNSLTEEQVLSLEVNRGTCIAANMLNMPILEFCMYHNVLGIDDSNQVHILPLSEAKKLQGYLSATLSTSELDSEQRERNLEYVATADMNFPEREKWEAENGACVTEGDNGGIMEFRKSCYYSTDDNGDKVPDSETPTLAIAVCDDMCEKEIYITISSKAEIRKLRDYLNNYLEHSLE